MLIFFKIKELLAIFLYLFFFKYSFWIMFSLCILILFTLMINLIHMFLVLKFASKKTKNLNFPKYTPKFIKNFLTRLNKFSQIKETFNGLLTIYIKFSIVFFVVFIIFVLLLFI